jgi:hypothetical protein
MKHYTLGLDVSWSTSRGHGTYGWNICRLDALVPAPDGYGCVRKRYRTTGGGYDMIGTVLADWLCDQFQSRLQDIPPNTPGVYTTAGRVGINGAIGRGTVMHLAASVGIEITPRYNTRGTLAGFSVRVPVAADSETEQSTE